MYYTNVKQLLLLKRFKNIKIDDDFYCIVDNEVSVIIKNYTIRQLNNRLGNIYNFIVYHVDNKIPWIERLRIIQTVLKRDCSSLYSFEIRYGKDNALRLFNEKNNKTKSSIEDYIKKYGDSGREQWKNRYQHYGMSLDNFIVKYDEELGKIKWNEYILKRRNTYIRNKENGRKYHNGRCIDDYIKRHGTIIGSELYFERNKNQSHRFSLKYYLDKYGEDIGIIKWNEYKKKMNKVSLESYVNRYGEKIGYEKYIKYCNRVKYFNSLEYYIKKYGDELGESKWNEYRNKTIFKKSKYSKISQELFWKIYNKLDENSKEKCKFAELNAEWFIKYNKNIYFFDFVINKIVIEFDGIYWHSLEKTKRNDEQKNLILNNLKYKLLRINEIDYLKNNDDVLNKCITFINENDGKY